MAFTTDGTIGVQLGVASTTQLFKLGQRVTADNGQTLVYVQANGAVAAFAALAIDKDYQARSLTVALSATAQIIGISQILLADDDFAFVPVDGNNLYCLIDGTDDVNPGVLLAPSPIAAGLLAKNTVSGQYNVAGIRTVTTASGTTVTTQVVLNNPHVILPRA